MQNYTNLLSERECTYYTCPESAPDEMSQVLNFEFFLREEGLVPPTLSLQLITGLGAEGRILHMLEAGGRVSASPYNTS